MPANFLECYATIGSTIDLEKFKCKGVLLHCLKSRKAVIEKEKELSWIENQTSTLGIKNLIIVPNFQK